jgi:CubicO group peptidase (beta-lactamase class C family)
MVGLDAVDLLTGRSCGPAGASVWWSGAWRAASNAWSGMAASAPAPSDDGQELTLGDLSSHAAGLPRNPKGMVALWLGDRRNPYAALSVEQLHAGLARTRLRRRPGQRVRYSNLGAGLLGEALARSAGQP